MINTSLRRALTALLVSAVAAVSVVIAVPAQATADFEFDRIFGTDRYATAAQMALDAFPDGVQGAVIATGENFPDALAGAFLAGRDTGFPVLLVQKESVPAATSQALQQLGVEAVVLLGGTGAISANVQAALSADYQVFRIAGDDRFDTARLIAETESSADIGTVDNKSTAIIASGFGFADALAAGPISYAERLPILLTGPEGLAAPSRSALESLDIEHALIVGGPAVISDTVENEIKEMGLTTQRLFGVDRFATAVEVADFAISEFGFVDSHINLAKGIDHVDRTQGFADALAGAPHAGEEQGVVLLTDPDQLSPATRTWIEERAEALETGHIFGGTNAVSSAVEAAAMQAARNVPGEVVRVDKDEDTYAYVPAGSDGAIVIDYTTDDRFFVDGTPATFNAFESALETGDFIHHTSGDPNTHRLTNVTTAELEADGRTIGNVDLADDEFDFISDVTADTLRKDQSYASATVYRVDGTAVADKAAFELHLNEGDFLTVTRSSGTWSLTNVDVVGPAREITTSEDPTTGDATSTSFKIVFFGDDPATGGSSLDPDSSAGDTHYVASGSDQFVGDVTTYEAFAAQITPGDIVTLTRESSGAEIYSLDNAALTTLEGTADSIAKNGDGVNPTNDNTDGGTATILLEDGTTADCEYEPATDPDGGENNEFVVDGFLATETDFEGDYTEGDKVTCTPDDEGAGQNQRIVLQNVAG